MAESIIQPNSIVTFNIEDITINANTQIKIGVVPQELRGAKFYMLRVLQNAGYITGDVEFDYGIWIYNSSSSSRSTFVEVACFF